MTGRLIMVSDKREMKQLLYTLLAAVSVLQLVIVWSRLRLWWLRMMSSMLVLRRVR